MDQLPDEILNQVLDFLLPRDIVSVQQVSSRFLRLARDNSLWRYKCYDQSPTAASSTRISALTTALQGCSISDLALARKEGSSQPTSYPRQYSSKRANDAADWDCSPADEKVDWYSEYIARHATLATVPVDGGDQVPSDVRGLALLDGDHAIAAVDDGSLRIWDIAEESGGRRKVRELARAKPNLLFDDRTRTGGPSNGASKLAFTGAAECLSVDRLRNKAYVAVGNILNEVDLEGMQVLSQNKYAWPVTALSQWSGAEQPLTVGTSWSLHLYDPRVPLRDRSRSPEDLVRARPADPEESIAFLPNYMKGRSGLDVATLKKLAPPPTSISPITGLRSPRRSHLSDYAQCEPGPLSILNHGADDILICGRFPSILSYDRRFFPRLQQAIHSGARLSALASIPHPPRGAGPASGVEATLVACGEYGGRGSLELYSLPHLKHTVGQFDRSSHDYGLLPPGDLGAVDRENAMVKAWSEPDYPFAYKNRQAASPAKLLSVASTGTRIVFSDADGGLKWVERDGRGLVRRWNVNEFEIRRDGRGAAVQGEQVVRKIIPIEPADSARGARGDGDLLVWTGERVKIITTKPPRVEQDELSAAFDEVGDSLSREEEYASMMRRALERQSDQVNWMRKRFSRY